MAYQTIEKSIATVMAFPITMNKTGITTAFQTIEKSIAIVMAFPISMNKIGITMVFLIIKNTSETRRENPISFIPTLVGIKAPMV